MRRDTGEDLLGVGAPGGAIATRHLAIDDGRPQGLFRAPVGGVDRGIEEKAEEGGEFDAEMCGEAAHGRQRADVIERRVQPRRDMAAGDRGPVPRDRPGVRRSRMRSPAATRPAPDGQTARGDDPGASRDPVEADARDRFDGRAAVNWRYGAHPSRTSTPAYSAPRMAAAWVKPRPG